MSVSAWFLRSPTGQGLVDLLNSITVDATEVESLVRAARATVPEQHGGEPWLFVLGRDYRGRWQRALALLHRLRAFERLCRETPALAGVPALVAMDDAELARWSALIAGAPLRSAGPAAAFESQVFLAGI